MVQYFLGIKGIEYIWHGEWATPEVIYKGRSFSVWDVQEEVEDAYDIRVKDGEIRPYKGGWQEWGSKNPKIVKALLDDWVWLGIGKPVRKAPAKRKPRTNGFGL